MVSTLTPSGAKFRINFKVFLLPFLEQVGPVQTTTVPSKAHRTDAGSVLPLGCLFGTNAASEAAALKRQSPTAILENLFIIRIEAIESFYSSRASRATE
jgi:hypothetical protein